MNPLKQVLIDRFLNGCCPICNVQLKNDIKQRVEKLDEDVLVVCDKHPTC